MDQLNTIHERSQLKIKTDNYGEQHLITAISFSYSDDSMNYRGLKLMNHF